MNTEPTRPGGTPAEEPAAPPTAIGPHPAELGAVEDRLRRALDAEGRSIAPGDRLGAILAEAHSGARSGATATALSDPPPGPHRHWLLPAAAAAAVALLAGTVWAVNRPSAQTPPAAATSTAVGSPTPGAPSVTPSTGRSSVPTQTAAQPSTSSAPTVPAPPPSSGPPAMKAASVPVYYLGPVAAGSDQLRLFREFVPAQVPSPPTGTGTALTALRLAMGPAPAGTRYHSAWTGVTAEGVTRGAGSITVRLSAGTRDTSALATEQLVWTVQAALGAALPVRFELVDGGAQVSPGHPASSAYDRPTDPIAVLGQVAPIWVDQPARGSVVPAGRTLTVTGVASTFEANVEWQLLRDGRPVESGYTTASEAAPARASYRFTTKRPLQVGAYVLRVFETSAKDGSTAAEQLVGLTAR
ncbi:Gmad2 immunoglobulin-like domain-containing protein [Terrabacter carboxydivorans]|uniref:GerMN domain-containing protein n=1 Tax=Terrabacter carboxydivorans TaxID=619730 RepID=A0ABP5YAT9_9MICO